jgi:Protein of unknown function, DUF547/Domain found in Dishevelled, Egl-10, and Pleckstrin (DEP)
LPLVAVCLLPAADCLTLNADRLLCPTAMAQPGQASRKRRAPTEQVVPGVDQSLMPSLLGSSSRRASQDPAGQLPPSSASAAARTLAGAGNLGPDYPIPNFDDVYARMRHPESGFQVADRRWRLLNYPKCFIGSESIEWMMENLDIDRDQAVKTGQHLMDAGIIHHVTHSEPFSDSYYFFRFQEDDESSVLNMKRVWDPTLPSRNPVQVAQELLTRLACLCEDYRHNNVTAPHTPNLSSYPPGNKQSGAETNPSLGNVTDVAAAIATAAAAMAPRESPGGTPPVLSNSSQRRSPILFGPTALSTVVSSAFGPLATGTLSGTGVPCARDTNGSVLASSSVDTPDRSVPARSPSTVSGPVTPALAISTPVLQQLDPYQSLPQLQTTPTQKAPPTPVVYCGAADDVEYSLLAKSEDFRLYTLAAAELQRVQLIGLSHEECVAFFVNVYNALCLHCYVVQGPPTNVIRRWVFFRTMAYRIAGLDMSLDDIEHGILRGNKRAPMIKILQQLRPSDPKCDHILTKRDGRIHFVISAGTKSDPPVRILDGESVQEQLHDATVEFLSHSVKIDTSSRTITLPRIFLWYADDFPSPESELLRWVGQYLLAESSTTLASLLASDDVPPTVSYENFEWSVSDARFNAAVVRRKRRRLERERGAAQSGALATYPGGSSPNLLGDGGPRQMHQASGGTSLQFGNTADAATTALGRNSSFARSVPNVTAFRAIGLQSPPSHDMLHVSADASPNFSASGPAPGQHHFLDRPEQYQAKFPSGDVQVQTSDQHADDGISSFNNACADRPK